MGVYTIKMNKTCLLQASRLVFFVIEIEIIKTIKNYFELPNFTWFLMYVTGHIRFLSCLRSIKLKWAQI